MKNVLMEVTSEVSPFFQQDTESKPLVNIKNVISKFSFTLPDSGESNQVENFSRKDSDGDYLLARNINETGHFNKEVTLYIEHDTSTELNLVGLQVWRGAFLLADYLIYARKEMLGKTVLELGAGVGLTSIVAGMFAKQILCTDVDRGDILDLLRCNLNRNRELIKGIVAVQEIDFFNDEWATEVWDCLTEASIILAADVIYDNDITEAFIKTITKILSISPRKTLYLAMEKRYVFTVDDLDTVAPCYHHLLSCLEEAKMREPFSKWNVEEIPLKFPQYFNYERVKELIMLKISS